jgi:hypothetical protein
VSGREFLTKLQPNFRNAISHSFFVLGEMGGVWWGFQEKQCEVAGNRQIWYKNVPIVGGVQVEYGWKVCLMQDGFCGGWVGIRRG